MWFFFQGLGQTLYQQFNKIECLQSSHAITRVMVQLIGFNRQSKYDSYSFCTVHARSERTCTQHNTFTDKHGYVR